MDCQDINNKSSNSISETLDLHYQHYTSIFGTTTIILTSDPPPPPSIKLIALYYILYKFSSMQLYLYGSLLI